ncbi:MAG: zinc-binding dehydrogenase [Acidimicrobiales bacterium]|nr:zinc-binding dehydrogenase [Acidimicrobiales bacterium]
MMREGRRAVYVGAGRPVEIHTAEVADPPPGGVLVRTTIAGVCGTDAHRLDGDLPEPGFPVTFGHEGIGVIEALGTGVTRDGVGVPVSVGDTVYFTPSSARPGEPSPVGWPPPAEVPNPAAYQDYATILPGGLFHRIPDDTRPEAVIAFGCAMPTALGGIARLGGIAPGQTVVVQGCGPVGLSATLLAAQSSASRVIVIGAPDVRLRAAVMLGADVAIPLEGTTVEERRDRVAGLTGGHGADVVIEATGRMEAFAEGMDLVGPSGAYLVMGIYSGHGTVELDPIRLNNLSQRIVGTMGPAGLGDYVTTIALARRFGERLAFADLITHRFGLADIEAAIGTARSGEAIKAIVEPALG